jgi:hypothetical protein
MRRNLNGARAPKQAVSFRAPADARVVRDGAILGKAMSSLPAGKGLVLVLVSLQ